MSDYKSIVGKGIKFVSSNLDNAQAEGQIWYNSTDGKYRDLLVLSAWASSTPLPIATNQSGEAGINTASLIFGGSSPANNAEDATYEYNGLGYSNSGNLNTSRTGISGAGTQTAGLGAGGYLFPGSSNNTETYNGSSWTAATAMPTSNSYASCGTQTSALYVTSSTTLEYSSPSWSSGNGLNTPRAEASMAGTQTASIFFGGGPQTSASAASEEYNGTSFVNSGTMNTARGIQINGAGTQTSALAYGGAGPTEPGRSAATESWDGTSWTTQNSLATVTAQAQKGGSTSADSTSGIAAGGLTPGRSSKTEEYNTSLNVITGAAWASGSATNTALGTTAGSGTQTAGIIFSGADNKNNTELYDGSSWTAGPTLNTGRYGAGEATNAPQTAALCFGGYSEPPNTNRAQTEEYDGSSWSEQNDLPTGIRQLSGFGTQTAAVSVSGWSTDYVAESYEYNGASWTAAGNINVYRERSASFGLETAGVTVGGNVPPSHAHSATVEEYNGASWTTATAYPTGIKMAAACGIQTDGLVFSGNTPPNSVTGLTLGYDGTSWSTRPSMATARQAGAGAGTSTAALMSAGSNVGGTSLTTTEEFTGDTTALNVKTITTS